MAEKWGLVGAVVFVVAVMGAWNFIFRTWAESNRGNPVAQAGARFW